MVDEYTLRNTANLLILHIQYFFQLMRLELIYKTDAINKIHNKKLAFTLKYSKCFLLHIVQS